MRILVLAAALCACACGPASTAGNIPEYDFEVVHTYPHDAQAYTQGLFYLNGFLYEGTGLEGQSSIRKVRLETGEVVQKRDIPEAYFGEGVVNWKDRLIELTWQNGVGFVYNLNSFEPLTQFRYNHEGWGITSDGKRLIVSDGSSTLHFWDPEKLSETGRITVTADGSPVNQLNELEWIAGEVYANIYQTDRIARIDPATGRVVGWIECAGILSASDRNSMTDVLNGIAYDANAKRLFITGKRWPKLFEIRLVKRK